MRYALVLAFLFSPLCAGVSAAAGEGDLKPSLDAESYVTECRVSADQDACRAERTRWSIVFDAALTGDLNAQKLVAQCLATGCGDLVKVVPHHACGWALLRSWATSKGTRNPLIKKINLQFYRDLCEVEQNIPYNTSAIVARHLNSHIYEAYRPSSSVIY
jgi:hypothetical protein